MDYLCLDREGGTPVEFLPRLSLRNRAFIALVCIVVSLLGGLAVTTLRQELIPSVELPAIRVMAITPGATSEQMASQIADPIERQARMIENVESTTSTSSSSMSTITVNLVYGSDVSRAASQLDVAISTLKANFPEGTRTQLFSGTGGQIPALILAVSSDLPVQTLSARLNSAVLPEVQKVTGVATAQTFGAPDPIVRLILDAAAMASRKVTEADIIAALNASGMVLPAGTVARKNQSLDVTVGRPVTDVADLAAIPLKPPATTGTPGVPATAPPAIVHIGDVAKVERTVAKATNAARTDGRESVVLLVTPTTTGNVVQISRDVNARLAGLATSVGGGTTFTTVFDQAPFITESIRSLGEEGLYGLAFAVLVILIFLTAVRPTLISAVSIPLSVLFAFVGMMVTGTTLNMLSLAGLTLSIGRMVDDSIVVIENITRHLTYVKTKGRAILDATTEVAGAVTSSAIVSVLTFSPLLLVSGLAGELFKPFALTVVLAQAASLLVALTIIPVLAYWVMKPTPIGAASQAEADELAEQREERYWLTRLYTGPLHWALGHRWLTLLLATVIFAASLTLVPRLNVNLLDSTGQNMISMNQTLPAGTSLAEATRQADRAEQAIRQVPGVKVIQTTIGGGGFLQASPNELSYAITTELGADQSALREQVQAKVRALKDAGEFQMMSIAAFGSSTIDVRVTAPDKASLAAANTAVLGAMRGVAGIDRVESNFTAEQPTVQITVDRDAAARLGLTEEQVVGMIAARTADRGVATVTLDDQSLEVYIASAADVATLDDIRALSLGGLPITAVATITEVKVSPSVVTFDSVRTITVSATPTSTDNVGNVSTAVQDAVKAATLPDGTTTTMAGISRDLVDAFTQLGLAIAAAILITYVVLVWIFKSLVQPLILLVAIPFAGTGSILVMLLTGTSLGLPALIALLMLVGIVITNSIVLIDLVNQYRRRGMDLQRSISLGSRRRLRPIVMTAAATVFALLPASVGMSGQQSFISGPLSMVTIGGLTTSTLMTLIVVPVIYSLIETRKERLGHIVGREEWDTDEGVRVGVEGVPDAALAAGSGDRGVAAADDGTGSDPAGTGPPRRAL